MSNFGKQKDYWKPCRPGTILNATESRFQNERRKFLVRSAMGVAVSAVGIFSAFFIINNRDRRLAMTDRQGPSGTGEPVDGLRANSSVAQIDEQPVENMILTCQDIQSKLGSYVVAFRLSDDRRTIHQNRLIMNFDEHLGMCHKCVLLVDEALSRESVG